MLLKKKLKKKIIFLCSGRGSNFDAVMKAISTREIHASPIALITDNPEAKALEIAERYKLNKVVLPYKSYLHDKNEFHRSILEAALSFTPDLIVTAGYMRILSREFVSAFPNKIINIHPSLLPSFPGLNAQRQALEYGVKFTGCTAHFVEEGVDSGPIILQSAVKIENSITERDLTYKILKEEHKILPLSVKYFCEDKIQITGRKVTILL